MSSIDLTKAPTMTTIKKINSLPMPLLKMALTHDFYNIQDVYLKEEKRHGKGLLFMTIDEEDQKFDVTYVPVDKIPNSNGFRDMIVNAKDTKRFMRIIGIEDNKCVTLKIEKVTNEGKPLHPEVVNK